jgi:hypothetical protein
MIRDGHPACRLKPASPAVPAASAKEENKKNNDDKRLGIHDVKPFQYDGFGLGFSIISAFRQRGNDAPKEDQIHQLKRITTIPSMVAY